MINPDAILNYDFGKPAQSYTARDAILYALGIGFGSDPLDAAQLRFLDERKLTVLPTFAVTLCSPGMWIREATLGVDFARLVHAAQAAEFFAPLPPQADVVGTTKVVSLTDRGEGKGAVLELERTIADASSGVTYCKLKQTLLLRGDGGFGGPPAPRDSVTVPDRPADATREVRTSPRAALIYRLSGDWNPLHLDPEVAARAGFEKPILQGLASYALAGVGVSNALGRDPAVVSKLACRFSGIVLPGDTVAFDVWHEGDGTARFQARVEDYIVLSGGEISWRTT